jgi:hypothetical protein
MRRKTVLLMAGLAAGCGNFARNFSAQLEGDPIGNWDMRGARVPASSGTQCVARCKQRDDLCYQRISGPGMAGNAQDQEQCHEQLYQCYLACPGSSEAKTQFQELRFSEGVDKICKQGLAEGRKVYCMVRCGISGQAVDPG